MIEIKGRGWRGGQVKITLSKSGMHIRVDDDFNPELWFEVCVPTGFLICNASVVSLLRDEPHIQPEPLVYSWGERHSDRTPLEHAEFFPLPAEEDDP